MNIWWTTQRKGKRNSSNQFLVLGASSSKQLKVVSYLYLGKYIEKGKGKDKIFALTKKNDSKIK